MRGVTMIYEDMAIFAAVVETAGFAAASRRLRMSKSTVSHRVAELEARLGARLLHRNTRTVRPTDIGLSYYERCVRILAEIEAAEAEVRDQQGQPTGVLRLCLPIELGMHIIGPAIARYRRENSQVDIDVEVTSRHIDLIEERFDLAFRVGILADSRLIARKFLTVPRGAYASPDYVAARGAPTRPADLAEHDCLHFYSPYVPADWTFFRGGEQAIVSPHVVVRMNNLTMLRDMALEGQGIAVLPRYMCASALRKGTLVPLLPEWQPPGADVYALYPSGRHLPLKVRSFLKFIERQLRATARQIVEMADVSLDIEDRIPAGPAGAVSLRRTEG